MENKLSIKKELLDYLEGRMCWVAGGVCEDFIRQKYGNKASCVSRRLRELAEEGKIEKELKGIEGIDKGRPFVWYKFIRADKKLLTNKLF